MGNQKSKDPVESTIACDCIEAFHVESSERQDTPYYWYEVDKPTKMSIKVIGAKATLHLKFSDENIHPGEPAIEEQVDKNITYEFGPTRQRYNVTINSLGKPYLATNAGLVYYGNGWKKEYNAKWIIGKDDPPAVGNQLPHQIDLADMWVPRYATSGKISLNDSLIIELDEHLVLYNKDTKWCFRVQLKDKDKDVQNALNLIRIENAKQNADDFPDFIGRYKSREKTLREIRTVVKDNQRKNEINDHYTITHEETLMLKKLPLLEFSSVWDVRMFNKDFIDTPGHSSVRAIQFNINLSHMCVFSDTSRQYFYRNLYDNEIMMRNRETDKWYTARKWDKEIPADVSGCRTFAMFLTTELKTADIESSSEVSQLIDGNSFMGFMPRVLEPDMEIGNRILAHETNDCI